ncbi:MAG: hypothetical protein B9S33_05795 [Pedosphaera sp. Tous-C6FEB]|nr:MAG: hypothetical protein B9S33_05795 [Pedosphaera sp. Tous-C6FEB]
MAPARTPQQPLNFARAGGFQPPSVGNELASAYQAVHPQRGGWKPPARGSVSSGPFALFMRAVMASLHSLT